jgi:acyl-CoA reductase-like NAD-dependent aldehyde dehydrogenase
LRRTPLDLEALAALKPRVRLVKGVYAEAVEVAQQGRGEIRAQFKFLTDWLFEYGADPAFGTHDSELITYAREAAAKVALVHPDLAGIHFTGSTATFGHLWRTVTENLAGYRAYPRLVGETGGKDFVVAHPSADVDVLRTALTRSAFEFQGQKCSAASRAYIPRSVWSRLRDGFLDEVNGLSMGDVTDFSKFVGAVIDNRSFDRLTGSWSGSAARPAWTS